MPAASLLGNISGTWVASSDNGNALIFYDDSEYAIIAILESLSIVTNYGYLVIMAGSCFYRKYVGLELAALIQLGYLSLIPMQTTP